MATKLLRDPQGNQVYAFDETADAAEIAEKLAGQPSTYPGREDEIVGAWDDVTPEGGGSSFAHLVEDTDNSQIEVSWPLAFSDGVNPPDLTVKRRSAGVLEIAENGGGIRLNAADGHVKLSLQGVGGFPTLFGDYAGQPIAVTIPNAAGGSTPGTVVKKYQVFDAEGTSLGYVPVYDAIS